MKDFLKYMLATILGLIATTTLFVILGIISLAGMVASSSSAPEIQKESVFVLELKGNIIERYQASPLDQFLGEELPTYGLDDLLAAIKKAQDNEKILGIYLHPQVFACSPASLQSIRRALVDFKQSGKFLVAYGDSYTQEGYYLASAADKIIVNPSGSISWHGLSVQTMFFKDLLDKLGVEMQIFRVGTYKSAVEPFISTQMSEANRMQNQAFANSIWGQILNEVATSRNLPADSLNRLADRNMDFQLAETYVQNGMADTLMYQDQVLSYLKEITETDEDSKLRTVSLDDMINTQTLTPKDKSGNIIAVYYAYGNIDGSTSAYDGIHSEKVCNDLRKLREDESVKAVVLRVNSPGGSAYGSEQIWREVTLLKEQKPVIVSMGDYAASGGYYISCAADWIVAEPTTLTGSIGIFGMIPNAQKLVTEKIGIRMDGVKTNQLADMGNLTRPFTPEEANLIQQMVNNGYELFTRRCAEGRNIPLDELKRIAEGRVWTGEMAKDIRLVDELGGLDAAIAVAKERAEVENYTLVSYPQKEDFLSLLLQTNTERYISQKLQGQLGQFGTWFHSLSLLKNLGERDYLQARIPFVLNIH